MRIEKGQSLSMGTTENAPSEQATVVVIGAGPTGLSAAYHLGAGSLLLEQGPTVGGWCRSIVDHG
ncbi:MAG TPA: NAD(P)-binding protein, partial [Actinomycetota bacterium]|nr:NAD(P)-binding protein [Actinomycetota bacterium]